MKEGDVWERNRKNAMEEVKKETMKKTQQR